MDETRSPPMWRTGVWRRARHGFVVVALAMQASCGGGGDGQQAGVSSGGTGTFSNGRVSAMGSIVVTGIHFDQRTAKTVLNADGVAVPWQELDVGMMVEVDAGIVTTTVNREDAQSTAIRVTSDLLGPVTAPIEIDRSSGVTTLYVMGQPVRIDTSTVGGTVLRRKVDGLWQPITLDDIPVLGIVEVYGFQDVATQRYVATRVELKDAKPKNYVVRGVINNLTKTGCRIGTQQIDLDYVNHPAPAGIRNGRVGRVLLEPVVAVAGTNWSGETMKLAEPLVANRGHARVEGLITERQEDTPGTSDTLFSVNGIPVRTGFACAQCQPGMNAKVRGSMENGVLRADSLTLSP